MADPYLMKGKVYGEHKHKLLYPLYAEVKYDEIRLHVQYDRDTGVVQFLSYAGKPLHNLRLWAEGFAAYFNVSGLNHLDMGVLVNGNFNDSYRWVRSSKGIPGLRVDKATGKTLPALQASLVEFYLFDLPEHKGPFDQRRAEREAQAGLLWRCMNGTLPFGSRISTPQGWFVHSEAELDERYNEVRARGLEGLMVKDEKHTYQCGKRIDGWLKMKPENEADGKITDIIQGTSIHGEPLDRAGSIELWLEDGSRACPAGIEHSLGRDMLANPEKYLGRWVEFKYMERDRQGGYRHPSFVRFREDKV